MSLKVEDANLTNARRDMGFLLSYVLLSVLLIETVPGRFSHQGKSSERLTYADDSTDGSLTLVSAKEVAKYHVDGRRRRTTLRATVCNVAKTKESRARSPSSHHSVCTERMRTGRLSGLNPTNVDRTAGLCYTDQGTCNCTGLSRLCVQSTLVSMTKLSIPAYKPSGSSLSSSSDLRLQLFD